GRAVACPRRSRAARRSSTRVRRLARVATASLRPRDAPAAGAVLADDPDERAALTGSCVWRFPASAEQAAIQYSSNPGSLAMRAVKKPCHKHKYRRARSSASLIAPNICRHTGDGSTHGEGRLASFVGGSRWKTSFVCGGGVVSAVTA